MLDLKQFTTEKEVIIPLINGKGKYGSRIVNINRSRERDSGRNERGAATNDSGANRYRASESTAAPRDGFYLVRLSDTVQLIRTATPSEISKANSTKLSIIGYVIGSDIIPVSFDFSSRRGFGESIRVSFLAHPLFTVVKVALWDDGNAYYAGTVFTKNRQIVQAVKTKFEQRESLLGVRGVTPELRYCYLLASLQREGIEEAKRLEQLAISKAEREKRLKEFESTFPGRLKKIVESAGGSFVRYEKYGNGYLVVWKLGEQTIKSTIKDDMRIINAGFCLDGDDALHSMNSIVHLAQEFKKNRPLYITRH